MITMVWSHLYPSSQVRITLFHRKQIWDFLKSFRSIQLAVKIVAKTLLLFGTVQFGYLRDTPSFSQIASGSKQIHLAVVKGVLLQYRTIPEEGILLRL
jgi:hypothetical protein